MKKSKRKWRSWILIGICLLLAYGILFSDDDENSSSSYNSSQTVVSESLGTEAEAEESEQETSLGKENNDNVTGDVVESNDTTVNAEITKAGETTETTTVENTSTTVQETTTKETTTEVTTTTETATTTQVETEQEETSQTIVTASTSTQTFDLSGVAAYTSAAYAIVNNNVPYFTESDLTTTSYEYYSDLDSLGRCGMAIACIGQDIMPTEERGSIGSVKPTGWHTVKYDIVDGNYLYNRCHLIGYQLSGENANVKNLITGTRYLNVEGMLPFENMVADYVNETDNHVLYRVTPIFEGDNLLASGVLMEAMSVEDSGAGVEFNVYCYNVQPGVEIDYATGDSELVDETTTVVETTTESEVTTVAPETETTTAALETDLTADGTDYILNTNTKKFHYPWCSSVDQMADKNKLEYTGDREDVIEMGYDPCKRCNP